MNIKFSRHAKRRSKLYGISESEIIDIIKKKNFTEGEHEIIKTIKGQKYPLKIVISVKTDIIKIITNYPLKKGIIK